MSDGRTPSSRPSGHAWPSGADAGGEGEQDGDPFGYPVRLGGHRLGERAGHLAPASSGRGRPQPRHIRGLCAQAFLQRGGRVKHPAGVAEAGGQQPDLGRARSTRPPAGPARGDGEVPREAAQVARARAPPAVDRLTGVADGGDRVPAAEQRAQQHQLGMAGVLVFIEEHHLIAGPFGRSDLGMPVRDTRGQHHLVTVVDYLTDLLRRRIFLQR